MQLCSSLGGAGGNKSDTCVLTAASENSGLYWCENAEGRTSAVSVTVSSESLLALMLKALDKFGKMLH